ncbi:MAG: hypothetical protein ACYCV4_11320, partial [Dermatophilaceae bacterium]
CRLVDPQSPTRVTSPTRGRRDLWTNLALQPLVTSLAGGPLPLAGGGHLTAAAHGHEALVGPGGLVTAGRARRSPGSARPLRSRGRRDHPRGQPVLARR